MRMQAPDSTCTKPYRRSVRYPTGFGPHIIWFKASSQPHPQPSNNGNHFIWHLRIMLPPVIIISYLHNRLHHLESLRGFAPGIVWDSDISTQCPVMHQISTESLLHMWHNLRGQGCNGELLDVISDLISFMVGHYSQEKKFSFCPRDLIPHFFLEGSIFT